MTALVWIDDQTGYRCPGCALYVALPKRTGDTRCPRCPDPSANPAPTPAADDRGDRISLLRACADGRREYASSLAENERNPALREQRLVLLAEANTLDLAAQIMEGDNEPLYGLLPSWRWTPDMDAALNRQ